MEVQGIDVRLKEKNLKIKKVIFIVHLFGNKY